MIRDFYGLFRQLYKVIINNTISQSIYTKKNRSNQKKHHRTAKAAKRRHSFNPMQAERSLG